MNIFEYAAIAERNWELNIADLNGYKRLYTFYSDFSIAEFCKRLMGEKNAIEQAYKEVVASWGSNIKAMTEVVMVLNHKMWAFFDGKGFEPQRFGMTKEVANEYAKIYEHLYLKADEFVRRNFDGEDLSYYYEITD